MIYQATKPCFLLFLGQVVYGVKAVGIILLMINEITKLFIYIAEREIKGLG
jgi:hypothetical protein